MYKIKSTVGEVRALCKAYSKERKAVVKNRRVKYIHEHINDKTFFGKKKFKSVKDVIRYMKKTGDLFGTIWSDIWVRGCRWENEVKDLYVYCKNLLDDREIWLQEDMSFLFMYKENRDV